MSGPARVSTMVLGLALAMAVGTVTLFGGCGGGSSSATGPGSAGSPRSGAVVQGQFRARTAGAAEPVAVAVLRRALGMGLAEAAAGDPVPDGTVVTLTPTGGGAVHTTTTTAGAFTFTNVPPGEYTIAVTGFTIANNPGPIIVGAGDLATVTGTVVEGTIAMNVVVVAQVTDADAILQNDAQVGHLLNLAKAAGVTPDAVLALRQQGMGWGRIAKELGVHPRYIGLGHEPASEEIEAFKASHGKGKGRKQGQA